MSWADWVDTIELIKFVIPDYEMNPGQVDFDNLPIKGYADPIDDEEDGSTPEESSPTTAATIMIPTPAQVQQPDLQC